MSEAQTILTNDFFIRFLINAIALFILLRVIYYRDASNRESLTGFMMFGNGVFLVTALLHNVDMSMGFAFGLFAVFSMLRYRTETLTVRDMTYLFVLIAISLMSSVSSMSFVELSLINGLMCGMAALIETSLLAKKTANKQVVYEKIDLIRPERYQDLVDDLEQRLGHNIEQVVIGDVDFLKDSAVLKVFYNLEPKAESQVTESSNKQTLAKPALAKDNH